MTNDTGTRALEREMGMVRGAIDMVAEGRSPRVTVGGLRFGEELIEAAAAYAAEAGVRLIPIYTSDERGADIVVEPIGVGDVA
jgi:hypothetical protein